MQKRRIWYPKQTKTWRLTFVAWDSHFNKKCRSTTSIIDLHIDRFKNDTTIVLSNTMYANPLSYTHKSTGTILQKPQCTKYTLQPIRNLKCTHKGYQTYTVLSASKEYGSNALINTLKTDGFRTVLKKQAGTALY